jgi:hypothetical protein
VVGVPGIGFPQNISVGPNVLDPEDFWSSTERRKTGVQHEASAPLIDLIASRHHRGHGFRPDGEMVAVEPTRRSALIRRRDFEAIAA